MYAKLISCFPTCDKENMLLFTDFTNANNRVIVASLISYIISEPINSYLNSKLKIKLNGKYIGIRFIISIMSANAISLVLFCPLAFCGYIANTDLISFIITSWFFMIFVEIIFIPLFIKISKKLKNIENMDIYDKKTNFNMFNLEADYSVKDNEFKRDK